MKPLIFCGYHNTGKTTLIEKAVRSMVHRGYSVSTIKHSPEGHSYAPETGDSMRLFRAGSETTVLIAEGFSVRYTKPEVDVSTDETLLHSVLKTLESDFIFIEGFKGYRGSIPKIIFGRNQYEIEELIDESVIAFSGTDFNKTAFKQLSFLPPSIDEDKLADFIEKNTSDFRAGAMHA